MALTEKVKGVQFNWVNYLWKELSWIEEQKKKGSFAVGLQALLDLLHVAPKHYYDKFEKEIKRLQAEMAWIRVNVRHLAIDQFNWWVLEPKKMNEYAAIELPPLLRDFCNSLDAQDYMEKKAAEVPEGRNY